MYPGVVMGETSKRQARWIHTSSDRMRRQDIGDPRVAFWFLDALAQGSVSTPWLDPGLSYLASSLRRHVAHRARDNAETMSTCAPRVLAKRRAVAERIDDLARAAEALERRIGDHIINGTEADRRALRSLLSRVREHLLRVRELELDVDMCEHWLDIGGEG